MLISLMTETPWAYLAVCIVATCLQVPSTSSSISSRSLPPVNLSLYPPTNTNFTLRWYYCFPHLSSRLCCPESLLSIHTMVLAVMWCRSSDWCRQCSPHRSQGSRSWPPILHTRGSPEMECYNNVFTFAIILTLTPSLLVYWVHPW